MQALTAKQAQILSFIEDYMASRQRSPTVREIAITLAGQVRPLWENAVTANAGHVLKIGSEFPLDFGPIEGQKHQQTQGYTGGKKKLVHCYS